MLIGTIALASVVMLAALLLYSRINPLRPATRCPSCQVPYLELQSADGEPRSYEVLACPQCTNNITRVQGTPSRFAYCGSCRQRTLETPVTRLPPTVEAPLAVEVEERCHVCGHHEIVCMPPPFDRAEQRGKVIPFPGHNQR